jgi:peptidoglycan hydrolase-like protein with peptidoglycan-binding domain
MSYKDYKDLKRVAEEHNFFVTATTGGKHNVGSKHYMGLAIDVRTKDKTAKQVADFMQFMQNEGVTVRDERTRPPGQKVWGGSHVHIEISGNKASAINKDTILKKESKGEAVKTLQNRLVKLGFLKPKDIDGDFGDDTEKAIIAFQTHYKIGVDGEVGDETKKKLTEVLAEQSMVTAETNLTGEDFVVGDKAPQGMFIRSAPVANDSTRIAVLPMGQKVKKLTESSTPNWWQVSTNLQGNELVGYVNSTLLTTAKEFTAPTAVKGIVKVHLERAGDVTRRNKAWAYALNEAGQPTRKPAASKADKVKALTDIIEWLDVDNSANLRYQPITAATYCNIYAYDYCYLAGVFLPRVWWKSKALIDLAAGKSVQPIYDDTVTEINANSLLEWLKDFGAAFNWQRTSSLEEMQNAANNGQVAIICAANIKPNHSGHIVTVVPETASHKAERKDGLVVKPLQSQAGRTNRRYQTDNWWVRLAENFREHGFWINSI